MLSKSEQLNKLAGGYLDQAGAPSNPTILNTPSDVPVNQQSFAAPGTQMKTTPPDYTGGQTWVPGVGMMGADLGGAVKGDLLRQQFATTAAENNRAEETLGMAKTKLAQEQDYLKMAQADLGIKLNKASQDTKTYEREETIQNGMVEAAQNGGFPAVIDYLKNADPYKAVQFQAAKLKLDAGMMQNETYQLAHQNDKAAAMLGGYQMLGAMGSQIQNTPDDKKEAVYKSLLPIIKQVDPNMPNELNEDAMNKMKLGLTLSVPAAQLYNGQKEEIKYQSNTGKIMGDLQSAIDKYGPDSKEVKVLQNSLDNNISSGAKNQIQMANTIAQNKVNGEAGLRSQWLNISKNVDQMAQSNSAVQLATRSAKNPDGSIKGPDDMATIYNYFKMLDPTSTIMAGEYANAENTAGWTDQMRQQYNKVHDGSKLAEAQRDAFAKSAQQLYENKAQSYYSMKTQFGDIAKRNGYNPDNVVVDRVDAYLQQPSQEATQFLLKNPTPELQQQFQLKYGQAALNNVMSQMNPGNGGQQNAQ